MNCEHHKTCGDCFSPNHVRTLETAIESLVNSFAESCEWNLATLDELIFLKSSSLSRITRQKNICMKMLEKCRPPEVYEKINWGHELHPKHSRTQRILADVKKGTMNGGSDSLDAAFTKWIEGRLDK